MVLGVLSKDKAKDLTLESLVLIFTVLVLGLVFFAGRGLFLHWLQELSGTWLLRRWALRRQLARLHRAREEEDKCQWLVSAIYWYLSVFSSGIRRPNWLKPPDPAWAEQTSQAARDLIKQKLPHDTRVPLNLDEWQCGQIVQGLSNLRAWVACQPEESSQWQPELDQWQNLSKDPRVVRLLRKCALDYLRQADQAHAKVIIFPNQLWIKPTKLGNRLAVWDDYAQDRYNIPTSALWKRLRHTLKADERKEVTNAQLVVEVLVNLSMAMGVLALCSLAGLLIALIKLHPDYLELFNNKMLSPWVATIRPYFFTPITFLRYLGFSVFCLVLAIFSYRGAVFAFDVLSDKMVGLIDLHRTEVLTSMGFKAPANLQEELELFGVLRGFFSQANKSQVLLTKPFRQKPAPKPTPKKPTQKKP
jgi:hypothetical protein